MISEKHFHFEITSPLSSVQAGRLAKMLCEKYLTPQELPHLTNLIKFLSLKDQHRINLYVALGLSKKQIAKILDTTVTELNYLEARIANLCQVAKLPQISPQTISEVFQNRSKEEIFVLEQVICQHVPVGTASRQVNRSQGWGYALIQQAPKFVEIGSPLYEVLQEIHLSPRRWTLSQKTVSPSVQHDNPWEHVEEIAKYLDKVTSTNTLSVMQSCNLKNTLCRREKVEQILQSLGWKKNGNVWENSQKKREIRNTKKLQSDEDQVLAYLAEHGRFMSQKEIAQACQLTENQIATTLTPLVDRGVVFAIGASKSRRFLYTETVPSDASDACQTGFLLSQWQRTNPSTPHPDPMMDTLSLIWDSLVGVPLRQAEGVELCSGDLLEKIRVLLKSEVLQLMIKKNLQTNPHQRDVSWGLSMIERLGVTYTSKNRTGRKDKVYKLSVRNLFGR